MSLPYFFLSSDFCQTSFIISPTPVAVPYPFYFKLAIFLMAVSSTRPTSHRILSSALRRTSVILLKYSTHLCIWQTVVICLLLAENNMVPRCMMGKIQPNGRTGTETHADVHYNHVEFWLCGVKWRACVCV